MTKTYNIHEAKTHLSRLIERAAAGEEIVIAKAGRPMVRLVPAHSRGGERILGRLAGNVRESEDAWAPDAEIDALFNGEPDARPRVADTRKPR